VVTPDAIVTGLASDAEIEGLHFCPFGGFKRTVRWACAVAAGRFTLSDDGAGFTVTEP
jgi:hypothetical protein